MPTTSDAPRTASALTLAAVLTATGVATGLAAAIPSAHAEQEQAREYDIPAGPLGEVLTRFASEAGLLLSGEAALAEDMESSGLEGRYTVDQALQELLAGTGVEYAIEGSDTVTLARVSEPEDPSQLEPIQVTGVQSTAYGPVEGYKAERSATATKTDMRILDVPAGVQVVPEETIDDQQATQVGDAVRNISSVNDAGTAGNRSQSLTVRGFDAGRFAKDGFLAPASFGDTGFNDLANVSRVEVLKGPASILFGQIEPGGLVNIVTKDAQPDPFTHFEGRAGSDDFVRGEVDFNRPISRDGGVFFRLNASRQESDSFRDHFVDDERSLLAPTLRWQPSNRTTVDVQLEYFDQERQFDRGVVAIGDSADVLPQERFLGEDFSTFETDGTRVQADIDHEFDDTWSLRTMLRMSDSDAERFSVDPRGLQADGRTLNRRVSDLRQEIENYGFQTNLTGEFEGETVDHQLLIGLDVNQTNFASELDRASLEPIDAFDPEFGAEPGAFSPLDPQDRDVDFAGIYLQDLVSLGDHWKILAGGRYEQADTRFARGGTVLNDATDQELSPRLGLIYKPNPDTTLYTSYTESFNPFVFRVRESGEPFEPETGEQIEAGIKRSLFDGRMTASLAGFEITKENVLTPDPDDPDRTIQTGEQRTRGIELDVTSDRIAGWQFVGTLSYLDAEVTEDNAIAEGNQLPNAPDWSGSLWAVHQFQQWPALELGGGLFFVDDRAGDIDNTFRADSYQRMDLFARYTLRENLRFQVNVNNVFDEEFIASSTGRTRVEPGAPLQAFARLEYRF